MTNWDIVDFNGDGKKDSLVDGIKIGTDKAIDAVGNLLSDIFN